jgi:hypothetical protein
MPDEKVIVAIVTPSADSGRSLLFLQDGFRYNMPPSKA